MDVCNKLKTCYFIGWWFQKPLDELALLFHLQNKHCSSQTKPTNQSPISDQTDYICKSLTITMNQWWQSVIVQDVEWQNTAGSIWGEKEDCYVSHNIPVFHKIFFYCTCLRKSVDLFRSRFRNCMCLFSLSITQSQKYWCSLFLTTLRDQCPQNTYIRSFKHTSLFSSDELNGLSCCAVSTVYYQVGYSTRSFLILLLPYCVLIAI